MSIILNKPITDPVAWKGQELIRDDSWIFHLSDESLAGVAEALALCKARGAKVPNINKEDFPVDGQLKEDIKFFCEELENGRGFMLIRGLNKMGYNEEDLAIIYYGIGLHMGTPVSQNPKGDMLGKVTSVGDPNQRDTRVYETNSYLPYHTDLSDVVGLLSIRKAKTGGLSSLVSAATVYNEVLTRHPEYIGLLYRPLYFNHLGEELPSLSPIFSYHDGKLACRYLRKYIEDGQAIRKVSLSKVEVEVLDLIDSIIHDNTIRMDMMLEPGDIQFANNYTVMHSRTSFEDDDDPAQKRLLLRLWLKMPNARILAPEFPGRNGIQAREPA
ncbi:TauD/TfdA family dioxygenase [Oceanobacter sp. 3_MG-2023]|uniref:TauD/TfdA family dioxygenase n=1 Tax=Oceanobacter sp. 3_MG-2023 TaxID=3062622 RepID=UPI00273624F1|nr:TauD/TfdA family dioxygenase [Oceanobacter sp. 3_MG-2023]MDP2504165.1 TauD/TfdA family dioxygenase [Oceanobacter sp. 3_MG-2023]